MFMAARSALRCPDLVWCGGSTLVGSCRTKTASWTQSLGRRSLCGRKCLPTAGIGRSFRTTLFGANANTTDRRLTAEESERLYLEEISNLQDRIGQLQEELATRAVAETPDGGLAFLPSRMTDLLGPEIYPGEFSDRLRLAAKIACDVAEQVGLDKRSKSLLEAAVARLPVSPALIELLEDLKRATKDPKRVSSNLTALLSRHGYAEKSDNRHVRLEAGAGYLGLDSITVPKTPSDTRGLQNLRTQVERTLGIAKLAEKTAKRPV